jgi:hypothetical protein
MSRQEAAWLAIRVLGLYLVTQALFHLPGLVLGLYRIGAAEHGER